jgi:Rrf2 family protein
MQTYISREQDYALRMTAYLAGLEKTEQVSISKLSTELFISRSFAAKIAHKLKKCGLIGTRQGVKGGIFLAANPDELSVFDVLDAVGFKTHFNKCFDQEFKCELLEKCRFHRFFSEQEQMLFDNFKNAPIADFRMTTL